MAQSRIGPMHRSYLPIAGQGQPYNHKQRHEMANIWMRFIVVDSLITRVRPEDCTVEKCISSGTAEAVKQAFPGREVYVWNGGLWREVHEDREAYGCAS